MTNPSVPTRKSKPASKSTGEQVHIVMPADVNSTFRLFGGILMMWIDVVAGVVGRRHAECEVSTASVDRLEFLEPAHMSDIVILRGRVTYVGTTSMEVCVETYVDHADGQSELQLINRAFLTMVAIGKDRKPTKVPLLTLETDEQKADFEAGKARRNERIKQRKSL